MTGYVTRRHAVALLAAASCLVAGASAQAQNSIKIGYAISKTGPYTGGASITTLPNYQLWVKDVNAAGGIMLCRQEGSGRDRRVRRPQQLGGGGQGRSSASPPRTRSTSSCRPGVPGSTSPSGRSSTASAIRTSRSRPVTDRAPELAKRWPNALVLARLPSAQISTALVDVLTKMKGEGKIGANVAMIERRRPVRHRAVDGGPRRAQEGRLQPRLRQVLSGRHAGRAAAPQGRDGGQSRHLHRLQLSAGHARRHRSAAKVLNFNPKVFFVGVGTAFPLYKQRFGANADGVMGIGGWNADSPALKDYFKRHHGGRSAASPTAGRARSPMPACRSCSRRSRRSARSIATR